MRNMVEQVREIIARVRQCSDELLGESRVLDSKAADVSTGAQAQAASIEQISAAWRRSMPQPGKAPRMPG